MRSRQGRDRGPPRGAGCAGPKPGYVDWVSCAEGGSECWKWERVVPGRCHGTKRRRGPRTEARKRSWAGEEATGTHQHPRTSSRASGTARVRTDGRLRQARRLKRSRLASIPPPRRPPPVRRRRRSRPEDARPPVSPSGMRALRRMRARGPRARRASGGGMCSACGELRGGGETATGIWDPGGVGGFPGPKGVVVPTRLAVLCENGAKRRGDDRRRGVTGVSAETPVLTLRHRPSGPDSLARGAEPRQRGGSRRPRRTRPPPSARRARLPPPRTPRAVGSRRC